jgi:hypothetical protein
MMAFGDHDGLGSEDIKTSGILYIWYKTVQDGMYWYKPVHLESVVVGYSDIFLEYSIYLTTRFICLEYIYLEYVNPFPIPGICLEYA